MMTPAEQFKSPRATEFDVRQVLTVAEFQSASVEIFGAPCLESHNLVSVRLRVLPDYKDSRDDVFLMLMGWDSFTGTSQLEQQVALLPPDRSHGASEKWLDPEFDVTLIHEWTHGLGGEEGNGQCYWQIFDSGNGFSSAGSMFFWDTYDTDSPDWFWPDGIRPPLLPAE